MRGIEFCKLKFYIYLKKLYHYLISNIYNDYNSLINPNKDAMHYESVKFIRMKNNNMFILIFEVEIREKKSKTINKLYIYIYIYITLVELESHVRNPRIIVAKLLITIKVINYLIII